MNRKISAAVRIRPALGVALILLVGAPSLASRVVAQAGAEPDAEEIVSNTPLTFDTVLSRVSAGTTDQHRAASEELNRTRERIAAEKGPMLERMRAAQDPSPAFEFILGNTYYSAGDHPCAETFYRSAIDRFPTFLRAWNNLGVLDYTANRYEDAARCFSRAVVLGDKDPMTLGPLGYCLERTQEVVTAEMAYMQALAGDPENASWKEGLLRMYVNGGQYGRAESLVRRLIKDRPGEARFWLAYAHLLAKDGRQLWAIALLEAARLAEIAGDEELLLLGDLYAEQQLVPEAIAVYQRRIGSGVALGEHKLLSLAQALTASRKYGEAATVLQSLPTSLQ